MRNYEAAARILALVAGTTYSVQQVKTRRRKNPVTHVRITIDAVIPANVAFSVVSEVHKLAA